MGSNLWEIPVTSKSKRRLISSVRAHFADTAKVIFTLRVGRIPSAQYLELSQLSSLWNRFTGSLFRLFQSSSNGYKMFGVNRFDMIITPLITKCIQISRCTRSTIRMRHKSQWKRWRTGFDQVQGIFCDSTQNLVRLLSSAKKRWNRPHAEVFYFSTRTV